MSMNKTDQQNRIVNPIDKSKQAAGDTPLSKINKLIFSFRLEEFIALVAFFPMTYLTFKAYFFFKAQGHVPNVFRGDVQRWAIVVVIIILSYIVARYRSKSKIWRFWRDILPFAYCLAIYTNLHDTVHFANPNDIHGSLIAIDQWLFGCQPCVWTEQFIHPVLTEIFSFCYMNFFIFAPLVAGVLLYKGKRIEFRKTIVAIILCFYCGYVLYLIFPAAPPRIVLRELFTINFDGTLIADMTNRVFQALPSDSRCAFPSLHSAITLLTLIFAWKYTKTTFWIILPFNIGLILATVYLRHHYVIDIFAGFALALLVFFFIPKLDRWWQQKMEIYSPKNAIEL